MSTGETRELFDLVPRWWSEPVVGLATVVAGVAGMGFGAGAVARAFALSFGSSGLQGVTLDSGVAYGTMLLLVALAYAGVGGGVTYAYLTVRGFDRAVVGWPDRETARWAAGLVAAVPVLVGAGVIVETFRDDPGPGAILEVPGAFVAARPLVRMPLPSLEGLPLLVEGALTIAVIAGVAAPATAALFHGVLQPTLRRVAPAGVAVGGTTLAVLALASGFDPVAVVVVGCLVAVAGYAYDRTGNLAVPMVTYAVLDAVTLTTALLIVLSAAGQV